MIGNKVETITVMYTVKNFRTLSFYQTDRVKQKLELNIWTNVWDAVGLRPIRQIF